MGGTLHDALHGPMRTFLGASIVPSWSRQGKTLNERRETWEDRASNNQHGYPLTWQALSHVTHYHVGFCPPVGHLPTVGYVAQVQLSNTIGPAPAARYHRLVYPRLWVPETSWAAQTRDAAHTWFKKRVAWNRQNQRATASDDTTDGTSWSSSNSSAFSSRA